MSLNDLKNKSRQWLTQKYFTKHRGEIFDYWQVIIGTQLPPEIKKIVQRYHFNNWNEVHDVEWFRSFSDSAFESVNINNEYSHNLTPSVTIRAIQYCHHSNAAFDIQVIDNPEHLFTMFAYYYGCYEYDSLHNHMKSMRF
jgi:hypothetical protein